MNALLFFALAFTTANAALIDTTLKGPSSGATIVGPDGSSISSSSDSGALASSMMSGTMMAAPMMASRSLWGMAPGMMAPSMMAPGMVAMSPMFHNMWW